MVTSVMSSRLPPINWLHAFEVAARHMSFTEAGRELGVTQSAVSQRVRLLERHLGRPLFHRLPRGIKLAAAGESLLPLLSETFNRLVEGTGEIFGRPGRDRLVLRATLGFAAFWLAPRLARFHAAHPEIGLRVITSVWSAEYPAPGIDLEIRPGTGSWPGLEAERLTWDKVFPVCSPALLRGRNRLASPADLARHTLLHQIGFREGWIHWLARAGASGQVDANKGVEFDTAVLAIEQAVRGKGVALGRTCYVEELVAEGRLAVPFDIVLASTEAFYLVSPRAGATTRPLACSEPGCWPRRA
jgi:LysR family glycine cleavage system transcriptional activator